MPRSRVTWWCGIGWQVWSGVLAAAVALGAGKRRTAVRAAGGGAGLLKLSLQTGDGDGQLGLVFDRGVELGLQQLYGASVDAFAELLLPFGGRPGHFPSVSAC